MLDNYTYIKNHLINVTDIDKNLISLKNIINRDIMQKNLSVDKYYNEQLAVRNGHATYHLSYEFIINNEVYQIVLLDNFKSSTWTTLDDWDNINIFITDDVDIDYIKKSNEYEIFHIPIKWFYDDDNLGAMCEYEMEKIRPLIRKYKIKKILN
jgi:hypothetical protein